MQKITLLSIALVLINCKSHINTAKMEHVVYSLIAKGNLYGSGAEGLEKQNLVISNTEDWIALMTQMDAINKVSESFSETTIDFSEFTVIAVFDEVRTSGGHQLELDIAPNSNAVVVDVKHKAPDGNSTMVMTQPFYIVKMPKQNLPIVFE